MKNFYPKKPSKCLDYLDKNNFYDWRMSSYLSYCGFKCLKNVDNFDVNFISEKNPIGYVFKYHPEYPDELHKLHNDCSLAPEKLAIPFDMMSGYCKKLQTNIE